MGGTPPPRISRSNYNLNSRALLFSDFFILFNLTLNQSPTFLPKYFIVRILYLVHSVHFIPCPCFIPCPYFPVCILYLVHILYPVRSLQSAVHVYTDQKLIQLEFKAGLELKATRLQHHDCNAWPCCHVHHGYVIVLICVYDG